MWMKLDLVLAYFQRILKWNTALCMLWDEYDETLISTSWMSSLSKKINRGFHYPLLLGNISAYNHFSSKGGHSSLFVGRICCLNVR